MWMLRRPRSVAWSGPRSSGPCGRCLRVAIALMDIVGFTAAEVAVITGSPRGTVLARVHRGRKALARLVAEEAMRREP